MKFDQASEKAGTDALRIEIVERRLNYLQNSAGLFGQKNNRPMASTWFTKQLGEKNA